MAGTETGLIENSFECKEMIIMIMNAENAAKKNNNKSYIYMMI